MPRGALVHSRPSPATGPSALSSRLSTLLVAVRGSASTTRTNRGHAFVPRSGWAARNSSNPDGVSVHRREHQLVLGGEVESPHRRDEICRQITERFPDVEIACDIGITRIQAPTEVEEIS